MLVRLRALTLFIDVAIMVSKFSYPAGLILSAEYFSEARLSQK